MPQSCMEELHLVDFGLGLHVFDHGNDKPWGALDERTVRATFVGNRSQLVSIERCRGRARKDDRSRGISLHVSNCSSSGYR